MIVSLAVAALVFAGVLALSIRRPWAGALACIGLVPWVGLEIDPGVRLTAYRLALFGWLGAMVVRELFGSGRSGGRRGVLSIWGLAFLAYSITWTFIQLPFVPTTDVVGSTFRSVPQVRSLGQVAWLLLRFAPLLLLPAAASRMEQVVSAARVYVASLTVLVMIGFLQIVVWTETGVDIAPIGGVANFLGGTGEVRHGILVAFGRQFLRMSSFGGEPKGLGQSLSVGLLIVQVAMLLRTANLKKLAVLWMLFFIAMLATASTSALYVWFGGSVLLVAYLLIDHPAGRFSVPLYTWGLVGLCGLVLTGAVSAVGFTPDAFASFLESRTIDRQLIPDFDLAVWGFLRDHPLWGAVGVGLGNVHVYADSYIPEFGRHYMENSVFVAKSGYLRLLSEVGLIGLVLFLIWMWREIYIFRRGPTARLMLDPRSRGNMTQAARSLRTLGTAFALIMVVAFLARGYVWDQAVWSVAMLRSVRKGFNR